MNALEQYLDNYEQKFLPCDIYKTYKFFSYDNRITFTTDLNFLLKNIYTDIKVSEISHIRPEQSNFRLDLFKVYDTCIISGNNCVDELEACHIIEVNNGGSYDAQNGIILERNLHSTFDKNYWTINPNDLSIIIKSSHNGSITKYKNLKPKIKITPVTHMYLQQKYELFILQK